MGYGVVGPFECECGKKHFLAGISENSECSCGRKLYAQMLHAMMTAGEPS